MSLHSPEHVPGNGITVHRCDDDGSSWDAFVAAHEGCTNYHRYGWRRVIERSFGHGAHYLVARDGDGRVSGILPLIRMNSMLFGNFLVSVPFVNYGGLVSLDGASASLLLAEARRLLRETGADHVELRHRSPVEGGLATKQHKVTMILDLCADEALQWKTLDAKVRNQVRKAEKSGLTVIEGHLELLDGFYDVFCRNMRDLGTPVYGKDFFRNVMETFPDATRIISVQLNGTTIASGMATWFRDTLEVPWASSVRDYREMCPNNLLYWEAIRFAIRMGASRFDFGRSTPDEGTYRFKKQWGAKPEQLYWQYVLKDGATLPELNPANPKYRAAIRIWQRLPVAVTRMLGPSIVRSIP